MHAGPAPTPLEDNSTALGGLGAAPAPNGSLSAPTVASPDAPDTSPVPAAATAPADEAETGGITIQSARERWYENPVSMIAVGVATVCVVLLLATILGLFVRRRRRRLRQRARRDATLHRDPTAPQDPTHAERMHADSGAAQPAVGSRWAPESTHVASAAPTMRNAHGLDSNQRPATIAEEPAAHPDLSQQRHHPQNQTPDSTSLPPSLPNLWRPPTAPPPPVQVPRAATAATAAATESSQIYSASSGGGGTGASPSQQQALAPSGVVGASDDRTERWVLGETSTHSLGATRDGAHSQEMHTLSERLSEKSGSRGRLRQLGSRLLRSSSADMQRYAAKHVCCLLYTSDAADE